MEADDLHLSISYAGSSGVCLSQEQKAALQTSLPLLRSQNKFLQVYFWGKILGVKDDYFLAQGVVNDFLMSRKSFYSLDCLSWNLLPEVSPEMEAKACKVKGRLIGDPSHEYDQVEQVDVDGIVSEQPIQMKEEERLACVVTNINNEAAIVPRGAMIKDANGVVISNTNFQGLSPLDAVKLSSYLHFREPIILPKKSLIEKEKLEPALDFLDPINEDIPKGSWSLQEERGHQVCLRSLLWPGLTAYHVPLTCKHGYCYFGIGERNNDLPFML